MKIKYLIKKQKFSKTIYVEVNYADKQYILNECVLAAKFIDSCLKDTNLNSNNIGRRLSRGTTSLGKQGNGSLNSVLTAISGVYENMSTGTQRDFSLKTIDLIHEAFALLHNEEPGIDYIDFVEVFNERDMKVAVKEVHVPANELPSTLFDINA